MAEEDEELTAVAGLVAALRDPVAALRDPVADLVAALRDLGWEADTCGEGRYFGMTHPNGVQLSGCITEQ